MARLKLCRWNCGRKTDRICRICIFCCDERDRQIASGEPYVPPSERPGHRFYKGDKRERTVKQKAALTSLNQTRVADSAKQTAQGET
jgi:hypothetical protein